MVRWSGGPVRLSQTSPIPRSPDGDNKWAQRDPFLNAKYQVWMNKNYQKFLTYVMCIANAFYQCQSWRGPALQEEGGGSRAGWARVTWIR